MPRMFHRPSGGGIFLATPVYGNPAAGYAHSLFEAARAIPDLGLALYSGDCHVDDARNVLCQEFLQSTAADLVFVDADIRFDVSALRQLLSFDVDIVGATYPFKQEEAGFPVRYIPGRELREDRRGLIEVLGLPTGFLRIKRCVIERMAEKAPKFLTKAEKLVPLIFERMLYQQSRLGGDNAFCFKAREEGFKVYLAPEIELDHYGEHQWSGSWAHHQRCQMHGAVKAGLLEITHGRETSKTYRDMVKAWDNNFSVDGAMLACVTELARKHRKVLELGFGLSSLAMAATGAEVHSIENDLRWVTENSGVTVHHAPLIDGWYDLDKIPYDRFDLVVIDGPPRSMSDRSLVYEKLPHILERAVLVVDDLNDQRQALERWCNKTGRALTSVGNFGVVTNVAHESAAYYRCA